jgi:outer membrane phospholipase A
MTTSRPPTWIARLLALILLPGTLIALELSPLRLVLEGPHHSLPPGGTLTVTAHFLNPSSQSLTFSPPESLDWLTSASSPETGQVHLQPDPGPTPPHPTLPPGAFRTRTYSGPIPAHWTGRQELAFPAARSPYLVLNVLDASTSSDPGTPATPTDSPPLSGEGEEFDLIGRRDLPGQTFFRRHFAGHEPMYFLWGPEDPAVKFQFSIRYKIINPDAELGRYWDWTHGLHIGYTQTSLWDIDEPSAPFFDSSYKPELLWRLDDLLPALTWWDQLGVQIGLQHESNGKDNEDSRSLNRVYLRPTFLFGDPDRYFISLSPSAWVYLGSMEDNPDLDRYRGHVGLALQTGRSDSFQLAGLLRLGDHADRGSMQWDATYPLAELIPNFDLFLHAQYFNGWGESLLEYNQRTWSFRFGVSLFR